MSGLAATLSPTVRSAVLAQLDALDAAAKRARAAATAATTGVTAWFQEAIGADSTGQAIAAVAHSQETLARTYRQRAEKLTTDADALAWLRELAGKKLADTSAVEQLAKQLTIAGAAKTVAKDSAKDLAQHAVELGNASLFALKLAPAAALAFGVWWLYRNVPWAKLDERRRGESILRATRNGEKAGVK